MKVITSWGTSCRRSSALMWSSVSMDGERPPCRQKIWKEWFIMLTSLKKKVETFWTKVQTVAHIIWPHLYFCVLPQPGLSLHLTLSFLPTHSKLLNTLLFFPINHRYFMQTPLRSALPRKCFSDFTLTTDYHFLSHRILSQFP